MWERENQWHPHSSQWFIQSAYRIIRKPTPVFNINSWGGKCQNYVSDDAVSSKHTQRFLRPFHHHPTRHRHQRHAANAMAGLVWRDSIHPLTWHLCWHRALGTRFLPPRTLSTHLEPSQVPGTDITPERPFHSSHMSVRSCRKLYHIFQVFLSNFAPRAHAGSSSN